MIDVGIHQLAVEEYHADPCEEPSLSSSGINTLLEETPAHFKARHPRLTTFPIEDESNKRMDFGTVVHRLVLGEGPAFQPIEADSFRTKDAKAQRDAARAAGAMPILREDYYRAMAVAAELQNRLTERFGRWPIGDSERTVIWQRETKYGPIWCRALLDHLILDDTAALIIDLKLTELSLGQLSKKVASSGEDIQAAWYVEAIESVRPDLAGRIRFAFEFGEVNPPYLDRWEPMPEGWLTMARRQCDRAADLFARCLQTGEWPAWPAVPTLQCPTWREQRLNEEGGPRVN